MTEQYARQFKRQFKKEKTKANKQVYKALLHLRNGKLQSCEMVLEKVLLNELNISKDE